MHKKAFVSFSGGKDSTLALHQAREMGLDPVVLLNMANSDNGLSMSHAIPEEVMQAQANALGLPLMRVSSGWKDYEADFTAALVRIKEQYGAEVGIFGDIDIEDHLNWEKKVCEKAGMEACLPLYGMDREAVAGLFIEKGFISIIIVVDLNKISEKYLGLPFNENTAALMRADGIDVCGEAGEFHTLATEGPCFKNPLCLSETGRVYKDGRAFLQYTLHK